MAKAKFDVKLTPAAQRDLKRIDKQRLGQIRDTLDGLEQDARPYQSESLGSDLFRVRTGDYRIVYWIDFKASQVHVTKIRDRKDVYK